MKSKTNPGTYFGLLLDSFQQFFRKRVEYVTKVGWLSLVFMVSYMCNLIITKEKKKKKKVLFAKTAYICYLEGY